MYKILVFYIHPSNHKKWLEEILFIAKSCIIEEVILGYINLNDTNPFKAGVGGDPPQNFLMLAFQPNEPDCTKLDPFFFIVLGLRDSFARNLQGENGYFIGFGHFQPKLKLLGRPGIPHSEHYASKSARYFFCLLYTSDAADE